jgi:hypothetical protein
LIFIILYWTTDVGYYCWTSFEIFLEMYLFIWWCNPVIMEFIVLTSRDENTVTCMYSCIIYCSQKEWDNQGCLVLKGSYHIYFYSNATTIHHLFCHFDYQKWFYEHQCLIGYCLQLYVLWPSSLYCHLAMH